MKSKRFSLALSMPVGICYDGIQHITVDQLWVFQLQSYSSNNIGDFRFAKLLELIINHQTNFAIMALLPFANLLFPTTISILIAHDPLIFALMIS